MFDESSTKDATILAEFEPERKAQLAVDAFETLVLHPQHVDHHSFPLCRELHWVPECLVIPVVLQNVSKQTTFFLHGQQRRTFKNLKTERHLAKLQVPGTIWFVQRPKTT